MSDAWDEILQEASIGGVEFPLTRRRFSGGRDGAHLVFPHAPGQAVDDTGRKALSLELEIELFADVDESHYPGLYRELVSLFSNDTQQGEHEYVDPILPPMQVKVWDFDANEDAERRNGGVIRITIEEVTQEVQATTLSPRRSSRVVASETAAELDDALAASGVTDADVDGAFEKAGAPKSGDERAWPTGQTFTSLTSAFVGGLNAGLRSVDEVAARADVARRRVASVASLAPLRTVDGWRGYAASLQLVDALSDLAETAARKAVAVIDHRLAADTSAAEIALRLYKDRTRTDEIVRRNPTRNPNRYLAGTVLKVLER